MLRYRKGHDKQRQDGLHVKMLSVKELGLEVVAALY